MIYVAKCREAKSFSLTRSNPSPALALGKHTPTPLLLLWQHDELVRQLLISKDGVSPYDPEVCLQERRFCKLITSVRVSDISNIRYLECRALVPVLASMRLEDFERAYRYASVD